MWIDRLAVAMTTLLLLANLLTLQYAQRKRPPWALRYRELSLSLLLATLCIVPVTRLALRKTGTVSVVAGQVQQLTVEHHIAQHYQVNFAIRDESAPPKHYQLQLSVPPPFADGDAIEMTAWENHSPSIITHLCVVTGPRKGACLDLDQARLNALLVFLMLAAAGLLQLRPVRTRIFKPSRRWSSEPRA